MGEGALTKGYAVGGDLVGTLKGWAAKLNKLSTLTNSIRDAISWGDYPMAPTGDSTMTLSNVVNVNARYLKLFHICFIQAQASFTIGGTATPDIRVPLPFRATTKTNARATFVAAVNDGSSIGGFGYIDADSAPSNIFIRRYDGANWSTGASRNFRVSGFYEVD